jgi:hypothetical protein
MNLWVLNHSLASEEIEVRAETNTLEWIWGHVDSERYVRSDRQIGLGRQKIERRQRSGKVLARAVEWGEDEAG